jgi:hypothetical protein
MLIPFDSGTGVPRGSTIAVTMNDALEAASFHRHVELGTYPPDWAGDQADDGRDYGER